MSSEQQQFNAVATHSVSILVLLLSDLRRIFLIPANGRAASNGRAEAALVSQTSRFRKSMGPELEYLSGEHLWENIKCSLDTRL